MSQGKKEGHKKEKDAEAVALIFLGSKRKRKRAVNLGEGRNRNEREETLLPKKGGGRLGEKKSRSMIEDSMRGTRSPVLESGEVSRTGGRKPLRMGGSKVSRSPFSRQLGGPEISIFTNQRKKDEGKRCQI